MLLAKGIIIALAVGLATWFMKDLFSKVTHGQAIVLDGDTLEFEDQLVDLQGVDAPEFQQTCERLKEPFACGAFATAALLTKVHAKHLWCFEKGRIGETTIVAKCYAGLSDVGSALVEDGWAISIDEHGSAYKVAEGEAKHARRGIWNSSFVPPATWRQAMASVRQ